jgi:hypothetical protein
MNCSKLRDRLTHHEGSPLPEDAGRHLEDCAGCREFAGRLRTARQVLREHRCDAEPDAAFAARVGERLSGGSTEMLGWAAARLLPATLALVLVLGWFALRSEAPSQVAYAEQAPTDDLVSWALGGSGE